VLNYGVVFARAAVPAPADYVADKALSQWMVWLLFLPCLAMVLWRPINSTTATRGSSGTCREDHRMRIHRVLPNTARPYTSSPHTLSAFSGSHPPITRLPSMKRLAKLSSEQLAVARIIQRRSFECGYQLAIHLSRSTIRCVCTAVFRAICGRRSDRFTTARPMIAVAPRHVRPGASRTALPCDF
jgi:hypothetical protein